MLKIEASGMKKKLFALSLAVTLSLVSVTIPGWAYQEIEVKNGESFLVNIIQALKLFYLAQVQLI